jgi:hypothetical protein
MASGFMQPESTLQLTEDKLARLRQHLNVRLTRCIQKIQI